MSKYKIISGSEVTKDNIRQALELDRLVYDEEYYVSLEQCLEWYNVNNQIYVMVYDEETQKIIAYINLSPVTEEYYNKIRSGQFIDTLLPAEAIVPYDFPDLYYLYFSSIVIHPDYQNTGVLKVIFDAIVKKMMSLGRDDIYFKKMVADAVTDRGEKFSKLFGMKKVKDSEHSSTIYEVKLMPPEFRVSSVATKELKQFYDDYAKTMFYESDAIISQDASEALEQEQIITTPAEVYDRNLDVFLSFKNSDRFGSATRESVMASELYSALMNRGIKTFFSNTTLELIGATKYKQVIDEALDQCRILIVVGTSVDNITSQWVKYEWDSFSNDILSGIKNNSSVFSYIDNIKPQMLPRTLRQSQVFEKSTSSLSDICVYIENALGRKSLQANRDIVEEASPRRSQAKYSLDDLLRSSKKFFKSSFAQIVENIESRELEKITEQYSNLFSVIARVKKYNELIATSSSLIPEFADNILSSKSDNILKITGNNGSEKNAFMQLLYLNVYKRALHGKTDLIPFYINLPYYEKRTYNSDVTLSQQISSEMDKDLRGFLDFTKEHPDKRPIIFVDGLRDFIFSRTIIDHILSEKVSGIKGLKKVVSVDTGFTVNKRRQKKVISLAPTNFEYIIKIQPVDLADDDLCTKYYSAFEALFGVEVYSIHEKMKQMAFYEIDAYILRLSSSILKDNLYNTSFTISDLYEAMCIEMFNGSREMLLRAAETAYNFAYNETEFEDSEVFSAKHWTIIKRHKTFVDFLISYYYVYKLVEFEDEWDVSFFEQVLPKEVTRFITPRLNDSFVNEEKVLKLCRKHYSEMEILGKSEMTFWLGRLRNNKLAAEANILLKQYYEEIRQAIKTKNDDHLYTSVSEQKADLFLLRGIAVSLVYKGMDSVSNDYITQMLDNDLPNIINRGFHLEYYGDKPYIPNKDMLDFEDDLQVGEKTLKRLGKNITQHYSKNVGTPILELDLFTMCSLIQARIGGDTIKTRFDILPYVKQCISFLDIYYGRVKHINSSKIFAYFRMVQDDFKKYIESRKPLNVQSAVLNTYSNAKEIKRTGWVDLNIPDPESIVEHMYATWLMGILNLPETYHVDGYQKDRILSMIMIHDLGETLTGDIPKPMKVGHPEYDSDEDQVMKAFLLKGTYPGITNLKQYYSLWDEWHRQETFNSKVAKDLDCLQAMYQFCAYYTDYPDNFPEEKIISWLGEYRDLRTEIGVSLYENIIRRNPQFHKIFEKYMDM